MSKVTRDPFDNSQREKDEEKNLEAFRKEADFQEALINVLNTRDGMTVLKRIFDDRGFFSSAFDTNALNMARKEGKREFAQQVFNNVLKYAPEKIGELRPKETK